MRKAFWLFATFLLSAFFVGSLFLKIAAQPLFAQSVYQPISATQLESDIDEFLGGGATGYLVWQYSGYFPGTGSIFKTDPNSFFRNDPDGQGREICATLKKMSDKYTPQGKFVGVNIWDLGESSSEVMVDHLSWLNQNCGVTVVRMFGWAGGVEGVQTALAAANQTGVKLIIAIGDYSNGQGGIPAGADSTWYSSGYQSEYLPFANSIAAATQSNYAPVYALELANEPHCGSDTGAVGAYNNWVSTVSSGSNLRSTYLGNIGIGQMANNPDSACDSPTGSDNFTVSNQASNITVTSAHYYTSSEKAIALQSLQKAQALGKPFYIGEAGSMDTATEETHPDDYYIYPIPGIIDGSAQQIKNELLDQGYEVSCATPKRSAIISVGPDYIARDVQPGIVMTLNDLQESIDFSNAKSPIWRNGANKDSLFGSLETYWGYKNTDDTLEPDEQLIKSAPIYALLTQQQQCDAQLNILQVIDKMCSKLTDPTKCALYQDIPGFSGQYTTKSLYEAVKSQGITCERLYGATPDENISSSLKKAISNVPLYLDKAYRLAFLVVTTEMKDTSPSGFFDFLLKGKTSATPKHEVRVVAFKLPDFVSNKKPDSEFYYQDALQLTRNVLQTQQKQDERNSQLQQRIDEGKASPVGNENTSALLKPIECSGSDCGEPAVQALVSMINDFGQSCQSNPADLKTEAVEDIKDDASISSSEGRTFADDQGDLVSNLAERQNIAQEATFDFLTRIRPGNTDNRTSDVTSVVSYLVYPYGTDLADVEDTLIGLIHGQDQAASFKDTHPQYFKLSDVMNEFSGGTTYTNVAYAVPLTNECLTKSGTDNPTGCLISAEVKADNEEDHEPRVPGAWLGRITRDIQQSLQKAGSRINEWISEINVQSNPTELYLKGGQFSQKNQDEHVNPACALGANCSFTGGYPITSEKLRSLLVQAASEHHVPVAMMNIFLAGEGCRFASGNENICTKDDAFFDQGDFLEAGNVYPYWNGCPNDGSSGFKGFFVLNAFNYPDMWNSNRDPDYSEICSIHDTFYGLANLLSGYGLTDNSSADQMKAVAVRWVLGPMQYYDSRGISQGSPTCEQVGEVADSISGDADATTDRIKRPATGNIKELQAQKGWLWAVGAYCCAIDHATGNFDENNVPNYCTTDPWVKQITPVKQ